MPPEVRISWDCGTFQDWWAASWRSPPEVDRPRTFGRNSANFSGIQHRIFAPSRTPTGIDQFLIPDVLSLYEDDRGPFRCRLSLHILHCGKALATMPPIQEKNGTCSLLWMQPVEECNPWLSGVSASNFCHVSLTELGVKSLSNFHLSKTYRFQNNSPRVQQKKDFARHAELCNQLLQHYSTQWKNRQQYWLARTRSQVQGDLLCAIVDSYDKSKLLLTTWPMRRCPKRTVYEMHQRLLALINKSKGRLT